MKTGSELIAEERKRQIEKEGWTPEHDNQHLDFDLSCAGSCYALDLLSQKHASYKSIFERVFSNYWPWDGKWWKPTPNDPVRQLVKAGALIAAEIDRLQRLKT